MRQSVINGGSIRASIFLEVGIMLFVFLIPLSQYISIRILVLVTILALFAYSPKQAIKNTIITSWDVLCYLSVLLIGFLYSKDLNTALRVVETSTSILLLPIVFSKLNSIIKNVNTIYLCFLVGLFFSSLICLGYAVIRFSNEGDMSVFFFEELTNIIGTQPTYMAYYLCFALTISMYFLYYENKGLSLYLQMAIQFFFFIMLMLTQGRTAYVSMLFVFSFFILKFFFEEDRITAKRVTFGLSVLFMVSMLIINHFTFNTGIEAISGDYWERLMLWKSAIHANENYLLGVGTGDYKDVLNRYYQTQGMTQYAQGSYNSHNQFIQFFFSNGVLGLVTMTMVIARPLYLSFKTQNSLGILIVFPFIIYGMTEVFLGRYQGVVFFALCHQIVILQYFLLRPGFDGEDRFFLRPH